jgi:hypothetical protein
VLVAGPTAERDSRNGANIDDKHMQKGREPPIPDSRFQISDCRLNGVPTGIRTRVLALKGPRPRPLDDGDPRGRSNLTTVAEVPPEG